MFSRGRMLVSLSLERGTKPQIDTNQQKSSEEKSYDSYSIEGTSVRKLNDSVDPLDEDSEVIDSDNSVDDPDWQADKTNTYASTDSDENAYIKKKRRKGRKRKMETVVEPIRDVEKHDCEPMYDGNNNQVNVQRVSEKETSVASDASTIIVTNEEECMANENESSNYVNVETVNENQMPEPSDTITIIVTNEAEPLANERESVTDTKQPRKRAKKGMADPNTWTRNINKTLRMEGKAYKGVKVVEGRKVYASERQERIQSERVCSKRCQRIRSCGKIAEALRQDIFNTFWRKMDWNEKKAFVGNNVTKVEPVSKSQNSRRKFTYKYFFRDGESKVHVCPTMLIYMHNSERSGVWSAQNVKDHEHQVKKMNV